MASPADAPLLSSRSGRVKTARRLARRATRAKDRLFLAEGPQVVGEALAAPGRVSEIFAVPSAATDHPGIFEAADAQEVVWHRVDDAALASLAETVHPQGLVAVCRFLDRPFDDLLGSLMGDATGGGMTGGAATADGPDPIRLVAVCADARDPGNAGTLLRCADAAGAGAVVLAGSSVDPYNGKAVRASAGSLFHLRLALHPDTAEVVTRLQGLGFSVLAADGAGELDLDDAVDSGLLIRPTAWLFGNEAWGLPEELVELADHRVAIPIHGKAESLNLATAAAVCLYASARAQRR